LMDLVGCCLLRRGTICEFLMVRELTGYHSKLAIAWLYVPVKNIIVSDRLHPLKRPERKILITNHKPKKLATANRMLLIKSS
jgi:hypothetical protein